MPELPDITVYVERLDVLLTGKRLEVIRIKGPFLLRTVEPRPVETFGRRVTGVRRLGKRICIALEEDLFLVLHLMIAGRLHWKDREAKITGRSSLAGFDFEHGTLLLTEAGTKKRASLHVVRGEKDLRAHDPGGLDVFKASSRAFREAITRENHTLKRALTDPRLLDGIGNAYSDEILHRTKLSPLFFTSRLTGEEITRLFKATREVLTEWTDRIRKQAGDALPAKVTAFREGMAVHGRFRKPCPACTVPVQRIRYAENETFYCPGCQTRGRVLADRSLSRLLRQDWPRTLEELETHRSLTKPRPGR